MIEYRIVALAFGFAGVSIGSVALLLISGYWFDSIAAALVSV
ncbi:hypothetical protein [Paenibacillus arenosi]|nr:hypothetical protein [Paenibacillus arenosi]